MFEIIYVYYMPEYVIFNFQVNMIRNKVSQLNWSTARSDELCDNTGAIAKYLIFIMKLLANQMQVTREKILK